jgi:hypothetical protein
MEQDQTLPSVDFQDQLPPDRSTIQNEVSTPRLSRVSGYSAQRFCPRKCDSSGPDPHILTCRENIIGVEQSGLGLPRRATPERPWHRSTCSSIAPEASRRAAKRRHSERKMRGRKSWLLRTPSTHARYASPTTAKGSAQGKPRRILDIAVRNRSQGRICAVFWKPVAGRCSEWRAAITSTVSQVSTR